MKLKTQQQSLLAGLNAVRAAIPRRLTLPISANVLLEADSDGLRMTVFTGDIGVQVRVPADVEMTGAATLPAEKLQSIARELPAETVRLEILNGDLPRGVIACGRSRFTLNGMASESYPRFPAPDFTAGFSVPAATLADMAHRTAFAVSTEDSRPILHGVNWEWASDKMLMVATNGHKLSLRTEAVSGPSVSGSVIVPPAALAQVRSLMNKDQDIEVALAGNLLAFRQGTTIVVCRTIEGPYPNYMQVIPKSSTMFATFVVADAMAALRRVEIVATEHNRVVVSFRSGANEATFQSRSPDLGEANDACAVEFEGDDITIAFNAGYLAEALKHISTERVRFSLRAPDRAARIEPVREDGSIDESAVILCMPMRITD